MSRAQNHEFQEWWNKQRQFWDESSGAFLTVEIRAPPPPSDPATVEKMKGHAHNRSARQLSWLWILKLHQLAASLGWLAVASVHILRTANRRIASSPLDSSSRLYKSIKLFLFLVISLLCFELVAYFKGWHFSPPDVAEAEEAVGKAYAKWLEIRAGYLAPPLRALTNVCLVLFLIQSVDRLVLILGCFWIKFRRLKPVAAMKYGDEEEGGGGEEYPMVLLQIPMCNEREVRRCRFPIQSTSCSNIL